MNKKILLVVAGLGVTGVITSDVQKNGTKPTDKKRTHISELAGKTIKIGGIDSFAAMGKSLPGMKAQKDLEEKRLTWGEEITKKGQELKTDMDTFKQQQSTLSEAARSRKEEELVQRDREYKNMVEGREQDFKMAMNKITGGLTENVRQAAEKIATKEKLDVVFDRATGAVVYMSPKIDITKKIIDEMDKDYTQKLAANRSKGKTAA